MIDLDTLVLRHGNHKSAAQGLCIMEAVAYFAKEPHSDHPKCACPALTNYLMRLNDRWDDEERQRLKPYIMRVIGTRDGRELERAKILAWHAITVMTPIAMRAIKLEEHAAKLEALPLYDWTAARKACQEARKATAYATYAAAAADAATYADAYAAAAATYAAATAAAAADAAVAAAYAHADAYAYAAAVRKARALVNGKALEALELALAVGK